MSFSLRGAREVRLHGLIDSRPPLSRMTIKEVELFNGESDLLHLLYFETSLTDPAQYVIDKVSVDALRLYDAERSLDRVRKRCRTRGFSPPLHFSGKGVVDN